MATFHDMLVTLAFLAFFGYDLSLNVVAAILTITGYSVNDTIVIFDRVRENLRSMRRDSLEHVVNTSVNQTLGRTIITAGTTLLSVRRAVPVRRRGAEGLRLHDDRRDHQRDVLDVFIAAAIAIILSRQARAGQGAGAARGRRGRRRRPGRPNNRKNRAS